MNYEVNKFPNFQQKNYYLPKLYFLVYDFYKHALKAHKINMFSGMAYILFLNIINILESGKQNVDFILHYYHSIQF